MSSKRVSTPNRIPSTGPSRWAGRLESLEGDCLALPGGERDPVTTARRVGERQERDLPSIRLQPPAPLGSILRYTSERGSGAAGGTRRDKGGMERATRWRPSCKIRRRTKALSEALAGPLGGLLVGGVVLGWEPACRRLSHHPGQPRVNAQHVGL